MKESIVRTVVPLVVGWLVSIGLVGWLNLSQSAVTMAVTSVVSALYYIVVRVIETKFPKWGILLGVAKQPSYSNPKSVTPPQSSLPVDPFEPDSGI